MLNIPQGFDKLALVARAPKPGLVAPRGDANSQGLEAAPK